MKDMTTDRKPIIRRNPDASVDGIIIRGADIHIEQMAAGHWWVLVTQADGTMMRISLHSQRRIHLSLTKEGEE